MDGNPAFLGDNALPAEWATSRLGEAVNHAADDKARMVLTRDGKPVAAIVPIEDYETLEALEDTADERLAAEAFAAWEAAGKPRGIPMDEVARELGIDLSAL